MRRIWDLRKHGLPDTLLDIWVRQQGEFLLPVQEVAAWLGADLLLHEGRPVELYQGVLWRDTFRYRAYNTGDEGEERLAKVNSVAPR